MAIIKTYPLKSNYYGPDRLILSDMQPDSLGVVHGTTKSLTLSSLKSFIGSGSSSFTLVVDRTSGAATFDTNTKILNIPDYSIANPVDGSGTAGRIPKWSDSNTLGDSEIFQSGTSIGIGTTSPAEKLDVNGDVTFGTGNKFQTVVNAIKGLGANAVFLRSALSSAANPSFSNSDDQNTGMFLPGSDVVGFTTNASEKMRITSTGNIGIGTTAPTAGLQVKIGTVATPADYAAFLANDTARFNSNHSNEYGIGIGYVNATTDTFGMQSGTTSVVKPLSLNPFGGNVGIGTTSPSAKLDVAGSVNVTGIATLKGDGTNDGKLRFNCSANTHYVEIVGPTHSGGSSYSLKLPNSLPNVSAQILQSNASGVLGWIPTPSGGGGGGGGTITSVGLTMPSSFSVTGSPLSGTGGTISVGVTGGSSGEYLDYQGNWSTPTGTYALPQATNTVRGGIELGSNSQLTAQITAGSAGVAGKTYPVQLNSGGQAAVYVPWANTVVSPGGSSGSVQFRNASGNFTGVSSLIFDGSGILTVGEAGGDRGIVIIEADPGADSGILKIGHSNETNYISLGIGDASMSTNYSIDLPVAAPGGNNKILESNSSGQLSWITTPNYTLPEATATVRGGIELFSNTTQATAANSVTTTASRTYGIQLNAANQAVVNVPWVGGGTGSPAGSANNVQFNDGTSFSADVNFNWDASAEKLILGKDSNPQFQEGILRLLGDGQGGTAGTIEFQSAQGKAGGAAATLKLQGPTAGVTQEILLPDALPTANTQILGIDTIVGTKVTTQWETPSTGTTYTAGSGITINSGNEIINADKGSAQFIYKNIAASTGGTATANSNNDTLTIAAGSGVTTTRSGDTITVAATGSGSYEDGFVPLDIYASTGQVGNLTGGFSYMRQTLTTNSAVINRIDFFVTSIGSNIYTPEISFALFDSANLKNSLGTCRAVASSSTLTAGLINTMSFTDGEGSALDYTCVPGKQLVLFFAFKNMQIAGGAALGNTNIGIEQDSIVVAPTAGDTLSSTKNAFNDAVTNTKIIACHFYKA